MVLVPRVHQEAHSLNEIDFRIPATIKEVELKSGFQNLHYFSRSGDINITNVMHKILRTRSMDMTKLEEKILIRREVMGTTHLSDISYMYSGGIHRGVHQSPKSQINT